MTNQSAEAHTHRCAEERCRTPEPAVEARRGDAAEHRSDAAAVSDAGAVAEEQPADEAGESGR